VSTDFRSARMESAEGYGQARQVWIKALNKYLGAMDRAAGPVVEPLLRPIAARLEAELMGFWLLWHLEGGFEGLRQLGMSRTTIYRKIKYFRLATGEHPDEYKLAGVNINVEKYLAATVSKDTDT
jgi:hypothetical protein